MIDAALRFRARQSVPRPCLDCQLCRREAQRRSTDPDVLRYRAEKAKRVDRPTPAPTGTTWFSWGRRPGLSDLTFRDP